MIITGYEYKIEKTKDDLGILKINKDEKWIYIGSKYNMKDDIQNFVEKFKEVANNTQDILFVYGFGLGEHIKCLRKEFPYNRILVFEPNYKLKDYITSLKWISEDKNLLVMCCNEERLKKYILYEIEDYDIKNVKTIYFANYDQIYKAEILEFVEIIKDNIFRASTNINFKNFASKRKFEGIMNNLPQIVESLPAKFLQDKYFGKPAIIVSAGPSLDKNIDELKGAEDKALIMVGARTLDPLLKRNIKPSLLGVVDAFDEMYNLVKDDINNNGVPLLYYNGTNEKLVAEHKGLKLFFGDNEFLEEISEGKIPYYCWGGSIAHTLTIYALVLGCNPIIYIGQDLAYTDEKCYAEDSNNVSYRSLDDANIIVEAVNGGTVRTNDELKNFKVQLEEIVRQFSQIKFINATEGGARIKGTIEMTLDDVIANYMPNEEIKSIDDMCKDIKFDVNLKENCIRLLKDYKDKSEMLIEKCNAVLKLIDKIDDNKKGKVLKRLLKEIGSLDKKISEEMNGIKIIQDLLYPIIYNAMTEKIVDEETNELVAIENNKRFYSLLIQTLRYAIGEFENTLDKLK